MNSQEPLFIVYVTNTSTKMNKPNSSDILLTSNSSLEVGTYTTQDAKLSSTITAIYSELKKIHEKIGLILAGSQSHA